MMQGYANHPNRPIYLDYQATTPCDPRVVQKMLPYFSQIFGNPHSAGHPYGWEAQEAVEDARGQVAGLIGAKPRDLIFTSGATEANNLAIKGAACHRKAAHGRTRIITVTTEHRCVLESTARLKREGFDVLLLPVRENGRVCLSALKDVLDERVALVSIMAVNNEIGVIQDLAEIGRLSRNVGAWFHTDAAQAFGKMEIDVESMSIDLLSISAHKIYGPKGIGALFIRGRKPKVTLDPLMDGGGQERGLRSGTLSPALCVGLGEAASVAGREYMQEAARLTQLRDALWHGLKAACPQLELNGDLENRLPGNLNFTVPGIEGEELLASLEGLSISAGSACASASGTSSHVLQALGRNPATIAAAVRIGLGRFTTRHEIEGARNMLVKAISKSDNLSCDY